MIFDHVDGAAGDEVTRRNNRSAFEEISFRPRVLVGVADRDMSTTVLGHDLKLPLILGPAGMQGLLHRRGELAAASAASEAGTMYILAMGSSYSIEEVRASAAGPLGLQLYLWKDRAMLEDKVNRAKQAGYSVLCVTVDVPIGAKRERDLENGFTLPFRLSPRVVRGVVTRPGWLPNVKFNLQHKGNFQGEPGKGAMTVAQRVTGLINSASTWNDLKWLRELWPGKLVIKGILTPDDALRARDSGADAIIVSNHGGRQLDGAPATIRVLPGISQAVGSDIEVLIDGGIRRGHDVVKAIALGADACVIGRPYVYSIALGDEGPRRVLEIFRAEIDMVLGLLGVPNLKDLDSSVVQTKLESA